jgi:hypothetical protein
MPIVLIRGTLSQLGKQGYVWEGHGYWFHGLLGNLGSILWLSVSRYRKMMIDNRARFDAKQKGKKLD